MAGPPEEVQVRVNTGVSAVSAVVSVNCISTMFGPPVYEEQEYMYNVENLYISRTKARKTSGPRTALVSTKMY